jgi:hypothetical protein
MVKLRDLEKAMKPQFVWSAHPEKPLQLNEEYEGAKDMARMIFVGLAEMHGFDSGDTMNYLDMEYESYRNKLQHFRNNWKEAKKREEEGVIGVIEDPVKKFYYKVCLTMNAIKFNFGTNPYLKLNDFLRYE